MVDYTYVKAHQDDNATFCTLSRTAQLNCMCAHAAEVRISADVLDAKAPRKMFTLEPIGIFVGDEKMT